MPEDDWTGKAAHELPLPDDATVVCVLWVCLGV